MEETENKILNGRTLSYGAIIGGITLVIHNKKLAGWAGGLGLALIVIGASKIALEPIKQEVKV